MLAQITEKKTLRPRKEKNCKVMIAAAGVLDGEEPLLA